MGRWTYYSPLIFGIALALVVRGPLAAALAEKWKLTAPWLIWTAYIIGALFVGLLAQTAMIGFQGAFAQVLPVPGGRSIRGESAVRAGWLLLGALTLWITALVLSAQQLFLPMLIVMGVAAAVLVVAVLIYIWNIPAAVRDFPAGD